MATAQDLNLSLFKNESTICTGINNCSSLNRLSVALRYYSHLKVKKDEDDREIFASFVNEVYEEMVDDSNHLMLCHRDQMQQIADLFGLACADMKSCQFTTRHFESESTMNIEDDQRLNFFATMFDSLHFWICHCFDAGFRFEASQQTKEEEEEDEKEKSTLFDAEFNRMNNAIRERDHLTASFERISPKNNSKFSIHSDAETESEADCTFLDELYRHLLSNSIETALIEKLKAFVACEQFETDSVKMDLEMAGNISLNLRHKECYQAIKNFIRFVTIKASTFSLGFRFYYWPHYEHLDALPNNTHDHGGYKVSELFV